MAETLFKILLFSLCYLGSVLAVPKMEMSTYEMYTDLAKLINRQQCDITTDKGTAKAIHILGDNAMISFGTNKDVTLVRDGPKSLKITANTVTLTGDMKSTTTDALILQLGQQAKTIIAQAKSIKAQADALKALQSRLEKVEVKSDDFCYQFQGTGCLDSVDHTRPDSIFASTMTGDIYGVRLYHSTGYVTCNRNSGGNVLTGSGRVSHWGCGPTGTSMGVFVTDMAHKNLYPGKSAKYQSDKWYTADAAKGWTPMAEFLDFPGQMKVTSGTKYKLVYGEAYKKATGNDNAGKTCVHVYFKVKC